MRPLLLAAVILLAAALFGWRGQQRLLTVRAVHQKLLAEAKALGVDNPEQADGRAVTRGSDRTAARTRRDSEVRTFARDLIAFAKEMKAREGTKQQGPDEQFMAKIVGLIDGLLSLDDDDIRILIAEIRNTTELDAETRRGILGISVSMLAQNHPATAVRLFTESSDLLREDGRVDSGLLRSSVGQWAGQDPAGAIEWMRRTAAERPELLDDETRRALVAGVARQDPGLAVSLTGEMPPDQRLAAVREMAGATKTGAERTELLAALRERAAAGGDAELTGAALGQLATPLAKDGFAAASAWLTESRLNPAETDAFLKGLRAGATKADTGLWLDWIGKNASDMPLGEPVITLVSGWAHDDYRAAGEWLNRAADTPAKPVAVAAYATTVAPHDPQSAAQWALTLPAGDQRDALLRKVHRAWQPQDPAAAEAFARQHGIEANP